MIRGRVIQHRGVRAGRPYYEAMLIEVDEVVNGEFEHERVVLLGDRGADCRPAITAESFPIGGDFFFALIFGDGAEQPLHGCGEYSVRIHQGRAYRLGWGGSGRAYEWAQAEEEFVSRVWAAAGRAPRTAPEPQSVEAGVGPDPDPPDQGRVDAGVPPPAQAATGAARRYQLPPWVAVLIALALPLAGWLGYRASRRRERHRGKDDLPRGVG